MEDYLMSLMALRDEGVKPNSVELPYIHAKVYFKGLKGVSKNVVKARSHFRAVERVNNNE